MTGLWGGATDQLHGARFRLSERDSPFHRAIAAPGMEAFAEKDSQLAARSGHAPVDGSRPWNNLPGVLAIIESPARSGFPAMRRYIRFRDFDWVLLLIVLIICALGVMEIYSATLNTKFQGMHVRQIYWIAAGLVLMFILSVVNYQVLLENVPWMYGVCHRVAAGGAGLRPQVPGGAPLDFAARGSAFSALGVGQADPDACHRQVFCRLQRT